MMITSTLYHSIKIRPPLGSIREEVIQHLMGLALGAARRARSANGGAERIRRPDVTSPRLVAPASVSLSLSRSSCASRLHVPSYSFFSDSPLPLLLQPFLLLRTPRRNSPRRRPRLLDTNSRIDATGKEPAPRCNSLVHDGLSLNTPIVPVAGVGPD